MRKHDRIKGPVCAKAHRNFSGREIGPKIGNVTLACKGLTELYPEKREGETVRAREGVKTVSLNDFDLSCDESQRVANPF